MQYNIGTVSVTNGSNLVTAVQPNPAMNWVSVKAGMPFTINNTGVWYTVAADAYLIADAGFNYWRFALNSTYAGTTNTNAGYAVHEGFSPYYGIPTMVYGDTNTPAIFTRAILAIDALIYAYTPPVLGPWIAPTLQNSWTNIGGTDAVAGYYKDAHERIHLRGVITGGATTVGTTLLTLPAGYIPFDLLRFPILSNNALGRIDIESSGQVKISGVAAGAWISLNGISFRADG